MALISITRLRVRAYRFLVPFLWYSTRSTLQARRAAGFIRGTLANDGLHTFWTMTAWSDEASMRAYRIAHPHLTAMRKLPEWCDESSVLHYEADDAALPSIPAAVERMRKEGRPSKVNHPSPDHAAGRCAADGRRPRIGLEFAARA